MSWYVVVRGLAWTLKKTSRWRLWGKGHADALYKAAANSVGVREGQEVWYLRLKQLVVGIEEAERYRNEVEKKMREYLKEIPYRSFVLSSRRDNGGCAAWRGRRFYGVQDGCGDYEAWGIRSL